MALKLTCQLAFGEPLNDCYKSMLDARRPDELRQLVHRVALGAGEVPSHEGLEMALSADGDEPFSYTLTAIGTQRLDRFDPVGTNLRILRRITALDNAPVTEAVEVGQVVAVHLDVEFRDDCVVAFFTNLPAGRHQLTYYLRAETKGASHMLPGRVYPMYQETQRGETGGSELRVK